MTSIARLFTCGSSLVRMTRFAGANDTAGEIFIVTGCSRRWQWLSSAPANRPTLECSSTLSLQSRERKATHDPTAIHSARHDASNKECVEHAHLLDDTQDPNPGAILSPNIKCARWLSH